MVFTYFYMTAGLKITGFPDVLTPKNGDGDPEIVREIQIPRQVFRMEAQILTVISSPL